MKRPNYLQTHVFIKRLANLENCSFGKIAQITGKEIQTAEAWGRPVASNECPTGTGKANALDCVLRIIGLAHEKQPGLAQEMAEIFPDYVDFLNGGKPQSNGNTLHELIGSSAKEHTDVIVETLNSERPDFHRVYTEIVQAEIALRKLKVWVKDEMQTINVKVM